MCNNTHRLSSLSDVEMTFKHLNHIRSSLISLLNVCGSNMSQTHTRMHAYTCTHTGQSPEKLHIHWNAVSCGLQRQRAVSCVYCMQSMYKESSGGVCTDTLLYISSLFFSHVTPERHQRDTGAGRHRGDGPRSPTSSFRRRPSICLQLPPYPVVPQRRHHH